VLAVFESQAHVFTNDGVQSMLHRCGFSDPYSQNASQRHCSGLDSYASVISRMPYAANSHGGNIDLRIRDPSDYLVSVLEVGDYCP
jgi:hypothetical protein